MDEKQMFFEIENCLLQDPQPSIALDGELKAPLFALFPPMGALESTQQSPVHHPEGTVWVHTLMVTDEAAKRKDHSSDARAFMWAALLHDIGKPETTQVRKGRITAYDHDKAGARIARELLLDRTGQRGFAEGTAALIRYHMQVLYVVKNLPFADMPGMKARTNVEDVALLGYCDRVGRAGADRAGEGRDIRIFLEKCGVRRTIPWLKQA